MPRAKKVVLCGKAWLAKKILKWYLARPYDYEVINVVPVVPKEDWYECDLVKFAISKSIPVIDSGDIEDIDGLYAVNNMRIIFSWYSIRK